MDLRAGKVYLNEISYAQASLRDFASLADLVMDFRIECDGMLFSEDDLISCPQSPGHPLAHLRDSLESPDSYVSIAKENQAFIGFLKFDRGQTTKSRHRGSFTMAVKEAYWGKGIGTTLLSNLELWAAQNSVLRLELNVLENNTRAIRLYEKAGYKFEGHKQYAAYVKGGYIGGFLMAKII